MYNVLTAMSSNATALSCAVLVEHLDRHASGAALPPHRGSEPELVAEGVPTVVIPSVALPSYGDSRISIHRNIPILRSVMKTKAPTTTELSPEALAAAAHCLRTLAHPVRLRIVELLLEDEHTVGELAEACHVSQSVASTHLGVMRDRGILESERRGRRIYYFVHEHAATGIMECIRARFGQQNRGRQ